ncbi:MAG: cysteine desulfurase NifS [Clostridiales Family XIII bacterium]|jgi:cysteine desulfurase|nr:cysteine desulfurase NifS [Clostridiales Family XIII bacterium]
METRKVYLDHSATTPVAGEVLEAMTPYFTDMPGNPNSLHRWGREARRGVDEARENVASLIGADAREIVFTGCGSASDNLAIKGAVWADKTGRKHIITSAVEHHAVMDTFKWLGRSGYDVTFLPADEFGMIRPEALRDAIRGDTLLVSVMHANNEVGTINPIEELGAICRERGALFHTDAVQTAGHIPIDVSNLPVDMLTMSAHKMYGPKGIGALYIRRGIKLVPLVHGGGQEYGIRSGTENTAEIVGFGASAILAKKLFEAGEESRVSGLRDKLLDGIESRIPDTFVTGHRTRRLPFHGSVCVKLIEGEGMLLRMDYAGIGVSSGSACTSGSLEPSHVLLAMGLDHATAHGSVRLTLGRDTTDEDIDYVLEKFPPIVEILRKMSPYKGG